MLWLGPQQNTSSFISELHFWALCNVVAFSHNKLWWKYTVGKGSVIMYQEKGIMANASFHFGQGGEILLVCDAIVSKNKYTMRIHVRTLLLPCFEQLAEGEKQHFASKNKQI